MASNVTKWSRKRSIDEFEDTTSSLDYEHSMEEWKLKPLDEIHVEKEKRRRLDRDSFVIDDENSRHSFKSSTASSPAEIIDSKTPSQGQTPTQEIIYQLSPDHNSPLSSSSETTKKKTLHQKHQKGRRKPDEEEGEILSDISDGEHGQNKSRRRPSSHQVSSDVEIIHRTIPQETHPQAEEVESSEESSEEDSGSSDDDNKGESIPTEKPSEQNSESEEESTDSSDSSDESSDEDEEEEEEEEEEETPLVKSKIKPEEKKNLEPKKEEGNSEDESQEDRDEESESEESADSEDDAVHKIVNTKKMKNVEEGASEAEKVEKYTSSKPSLKDKKHHSSRDYPNRQRRPEYNKDDRKSGWEHEKGASRERHDQKSSKVDSERVSRKEKTSYENNDYKNSRDSKRNDRERGSSSRGLDRPEKHERADSKSRKKDSKSKDQTRPRRERESKSATSSKTDEKTKEITKSKENNPSKLLTAEERLQFSTEVVEPDSDDGENNDPSDGNSDEEELDLNESKEEEKEENVKPKLPDYLPAIQGCRNVAEEFIWLNRIEEGTYGVVYRARDKRTNEIVALKRLKMEKEKEGFPITSLREINTLLKTQHPNIVTVREVVVGENMDKIFIVMDYVEHDLKTLMEHMNSKFSIGEVKTLLVQLLRAVAHLHDNWILHRDLKTSNLLLSNKGILKVADFGLAREYGSPLKPYTPIVVTLWYRAPELLLGVKEYACPIDLWSVGCIFAELLTMKPLFPGKSEIDQINRIFKDLGTPSDKIWPGPPAYSELPHVKKMTFTEYPYNQLRNKFGTHLTDKGFDLLNKFLTYDPKRRVTAEKGLEHDYFNESPFPVKPDMFPTWPAKSEMMKRPKRREYEHSPKPPEGGEMFSKLKDGGDSSGASSTQGFHMPSSKKGSAAVAGFSLKFNL